MSKGGRTLMVCANLVAAFACALLAGLTIVEGRSAWLLGGLFWIALAILPTLNMIFLAGEPAHPSRLRRLWRLWLEAKERELSQRGTGPRE